MPKPLKPSAGEDKRVKSDAEDQRRVKSASGQSGRGSAQQSVLQFATKESVDRLEQRLINIEQTLVRKID